MKFEIEGHFSEGIYNMLEQYGMPKGAWLQMNYEGNGEFHILSDMSYREINFPVPPKIFEFPFKYLPEDFINGFLLSLA